MRNFPKQRIPFSEKVKDDYKWAKDVMDSLLLMGETERSMTDSYQHEYYRMLSNYQLFNNVINQKDFEADCNRFGIEIGSFQDNIRPYNKTYNKIQVLLGEELALPVTFQSIITNSEGIKTKLMVKNNMLRDYVIAQIQSTLTSLGYDKELVEDPSQVLDPKDIEKYMNSTHVDSREKLNNKLLQYIIRKLNVKDIKNDAFKHALISGYELVYVGENNGQLLLSALNPLGFFYHKSGEEKFVENAQYAGYRTYMNSSDILDRLGLFMKEEDIKKIDASYKTANAFGMHAPEPDMQYHLDSMDNYLFYNSKGTSEGSYNRNSTNDWLVQHVEWKSQKEVGFLEITKVDGEVVSELVDHNFKAPDHAEKVEVLKEFNRRCTYYVWQDIEGNRFELEWGWVPEVWEGTRIGKNIYCKIGPKKHQFRSIDNFHEVKLGYHGLAYSAMNAQAVSVMDRMKPFQYLYFIIMHKLKRLIAEDKGKTYHFDTTMVDPKLGWEKTIYYLDELNIDFYNPLHNAEKPGAFNRQKVGGSTDRSNMQHILNYVALLDVIDQQISDVAGISREREGRINNDAAVTNAQANIQTSSVVTKTFFHNHDKVWENVLTSATNVLQSIFRDKPFVAQYVLDDLSIASLEITPESFLDCDFAIFISNSAQDRQLFEDIKQLAQPLIQNDKMTFQDLIKTFKTNSVQELQEIISSSEKEALERNQQMMQQQMQMDAQLKQQEFEQQVQLLTIEHQNNMELEQLKIAADTDLNDNEIPDAFEMEKFRKDVELKEKKLDLEEKKIKAAISSKNTK